MNNTASYCIPHFGLFDTCPERQWATQVQFLVYLIFVLVSELFLVATVLRRFKVEQVFKWNNFYTVSVLFFCALVTLSIGFALLIVPRSYFQAPPVVICIFVWISPVFAVAGGFYIIFSWVEILNMQVVLAYSGLKRFRKLYWSTVVAQFIMTLVPALASSIRLDYYEPLMRLEWACWGVFVTGQAVGIIYFGWKATKAAAEGANASKTKKDVHHQRRSRRSLFLIMGWVGLFVPVIIFYAAALPLVDGLPWLWHLMWAVLGLAAGGLSCLYSIWAWITTTHIQYKNTSSSGGSLSNDSNATTVSTRSTVSNLSK